MKCIRTISKAFIGSLALLLVLGIAPKEALGQPADAGITSNTIELLTYRASDYAFRSIPSNATPPPGFPSNPTPPPGFVEFATAPFGGGRVGPGMLCPLQPTRASSFPLERQLLVRRFISIPGGAANVRIMASVDNDIVRVFFNGTSIPEAEDIRHDGCPIADEFRVDVPLGLVRPEQNLVAFQLLDRAPPLGGGNESFFDARILAEFPMTIKIPIRWCGVEGSPSMIDPSVVGADSTDEVLLQRLMLVNSSIYMRQTNMMPQTNMALRSGISLANSTRRFPIIPDPNPPPYGSRNAGRYLRLVGVYASH